MERENRGDRSSEKEAERKGVNESEGNRVESPADFNFWKMSQSLQVGCQEFLDRLLASMMLFHDSGDMA